MCACVHACLRSAWGCETTRLFHIVSNCEISTEANSQHGSFGVRDALKVYAVGHHDDPGRRALLADVTEHAQNARDAPPDVAAVVVFQDDVESSADGHGDIERLATLRRDWLEVDTRADDMESTDDRRLNGAVFESRRRHHPVANCRIDGARLEALRGALREHAVIDDTKNSTFGCARTTASHFRRCMAIASQAACMFFSQQVNFAT